MLTDGRKKVIFRGCFLSVLLYRKDGLGTVQGPWTGPFTGLESYGPNLRKYNQVFSNQCMASKWRNVLYPILKVTKSQVSVFNRTESKRFKAFLSIIASSFPCSYSISLEQFLEAVKHFVILLFLLSH